MMSIDLIREINREQATQAANEGLEPYVYATEDEVDSLPFPFAHIGDYAPEGWDLVDTHFVDSSGFGQPGEPALTVEQFVALVKRQMREHAENRQAVGWAIVSAGQFQVYVGEFTREV